MPRNPDADQASIRAVHSAAVAGNYDEAAALADAALAGGLEHPILFNVMALTLEQRGRLPEAEQLLKRAVEIAPADVASRNALGLCLLRSEQYSLALAQFDQLLVLDPSLPYAYASRGDALLAMKAISRAEQSYLRAMALSGNQVTAMAGLAHICVSRGAFSNARHWAEKALTLAPGFPRAVMSLASAELGERDTNRAEVRVRALLTDPQLEPIERAHAYGLLGDVLDAKRLPDQAFEAYASCNERLVDIYSTRFSTHPTALEFVQSIVAYLERTGPKAWKVVPIADEHRSAAGHVFLLGFPRSGTTLLEVILEGHPNVVSLEEKESLIDGVREYMRRPEDLDRLLQADATVLRRFRSAYWNRVAEEGIDVAGRVFVDKHPLNTLKLPLIARLFPNAKIIFACRDPRDIALSCFRHRFHMSAPVYELLSLEGVARYYDSVMRLLVCMTGRAAVDVCLVRHEDLVTGFARETKRICDYLSLDWVPSMGDFALRAKDRSVLTPSTAQLVRGLNTEGLGQWRHYDKYLAPILSHLDPWVKRFYYDT